MEKPNKKTVNIVTMRRSTLGLFFAFIFVVLGLLVAVVNDVQSLHAFDERRDRSICVGSTQRIERIINRLVPALPPPPEGSSEEDKARFQMRVENRRQIQMILEESYKECETITGRR